MSVIAEYSVPASDLCLGRAAGPSLTVELERLFPAAETVVGYVWVEGGDVESFERNLRSESVVETVRKVDGVEASHLYRGQFRADAETFLSTILDHDAELLRARGDDDRWSFDLRFANASVLSDFQTDSVETADVALELDRLYDPVEGAPTVRSELTNYQRETLISAYEGGYFDIPRNITLVDLAEQLDVSDQAVSERMRRGEAKLVEAHLIDGEN